MLARRRKQLQYASVLYPKSLGRVNHEASAVFAAEFQPGFTQRKAPGVNDEAALAAYREKLKEELDREREQSRCEKLIVSNEHLFEKVRTPEQAQRVCNLVGVNLSSIRVVVYLRPQPDMAAAVYAELLRMGSAPKYDNFLKQQRTRDLLNYEEGIDAWAQVLGDAAISIRVFDRERMVNGDVLSDFASIAGIDHSLIAPGPDIEGVVESRRSFDAPTVAFLSRFNAEVTRLIKESGNLDTLETFKKLPHRRIIVRCIDQMERRGMRFAFDTETVASISKEFKESNERLFRRFNCEPFQERAPGMDGGNPEEAMDVDHAFELMARLWLHVLVSENAPAESKGNELPAF